MFGEHLSFWLWFSVLCLACSLAAVMSVYLTIQGAAA